MNGATLPESPPARERQSEQERQRRDERAPDLVGSSLAGKYRVTRRIGRGGMGEVYEAEHTAIGKSVAIKILHADAAELEGVASRFAREARVVSRLESEHVVSVLDAGTEDAGRPYLVMELLRGEDLGTRLRRSRTLPEAESIHIVAQILRGLADAHEAGVIHRDLKPDNVFLTRRGGDSSFVKLVDFGISKVQRLDGTSPLAITQAGTILGTPMYMSPEQAQAKDDIDARTDIYAVGAILFECLTGRPPHVGETDAEVLLKICTNDAPDLRALAPTVSTAVARLAARALSRDRSARFRSARQMLVAIAQLGASDAAPAPIAPTLAVRERPTDPDASAAKGARPPRDSGAIRERSSDVDAPPVAAPSVAERVSRPSRHVPASRAGAAAIAVVATLSGGAATAWIVMSRRAPPAAIDTAALSDHAASTITAPRAASASPVVPPAASAAPMVAPAPAASASAAPTVTVSATPTAPSQPSKAPSHAKGKPRPSPGGLDLERDLE